MLSERLLHSPKVFGGKSEQVGKLRPQAGSGSLDDHLSSFPR
jgi:hypothetical protein